MPLLTKGIILPDNVDDNLFTTNSPRIQSHINNINAFLNKASRPPEDDEDDEGDEETAPINCNYYNYEEFSKANFDSSTSFSILHPKTSNDIVGVVYRHPSMPVDHFNDVHIRPLITKLSLKKDKNIHISGDFNINLLNVSSHAGSSEFFDIMSSNQMLPTISIPLN